MKQLLIAILMLASLRSYSQPLTLSTTRPPFLKAGDHVALLSPAYACSMGAVDSAANVLRDWGLVPVIGPNVGQVFAGKYAGTIAERVADLRWALNDTSIKATAVATGRYTTSTPSPSRNGARTPNGSWASATSPRYMGC